MAPELCEMPLCMVLYASLDYAGHRSKSVTVGECRKLLSYSTHAITESLSSAPSHEW